MSYRAALYRPKTLPLLERIPWATCLITVGTIVLWGITAYQAALLVGAHTQHDILAHIFNNAIDIQPQDNQAVSTVLVAYGAKDNTLILQGQYWRFITPIFLHSNALHVGLNMLNFFIAGWFMERMLGAPRFLLIYLLTGVVGAVASFYFEPGDVGVGASGAIFGLVGAYGTFILAHRRAFSFAGIPAILFLVIVIGVNLSIGYFVQGIDNYAHLGGLLSGCILGLWFTPLYRPSPTGELVDKNSISHRWLLALLTILGTLVLAIIAIYIVGKSSR